MRTPLPRKRFSLHLLTTLTLVAAIAFSRTTSGAPGPYAESAHGDSTHGVANRAPGYGTGNCTHCHSQHASIGGGEPAPVDGGPSPFALFTKNFNTAATGKPYTQSDNMCFYCHRGVGSSFQQVTNYPYTRTFGGYTALTNNNILDTFNQGDSYHNLYNIWSFFKNVGTDKGLAGTEFFTEESNPCVACHNPHLAKRNNASPTDPGKTSISRPTDHFTLWGDSSDSSELMSKYTTYRSPYYYNSTTTYEPAGTATNDGSLTPDYNTFCLDCHQYEVPAPSGVVSMNSSTTSGYLSAINWSATGDMHGQRQRINDINGAPKGFGTVTAPYNVAPVAGNYVLSCLDCHEPHGTSLNKMARSSSYLLRKVVNGKVITGCGVGAGDYCENNFCTACHTYSHGCGGPQGCFSCHHHGATNKNCFGLWNGPNF